MHACQTFVLGPDRHVAHNDRWPSTALARAIFLTKVSHAGGPADLRAGAGAGEGVGCDRRRRPRALVHPVQAFPRRGVRAAWTATVVIAPGASGTEHIGPTCQAKWIHSPPSTCATSQRDRSRRRSNAKGLSAFDPC